MFRVEEEKESRARRGDWDLLEGGRVKEMRVG